MPWDWADRFVRYALDGSGLRRRLLERRGTLKDEATDRWWDAYRELVEEGRGLLFDLEHLVVPRLSGELRSEFRRARRALLRLHLAVRNVGPEGGNDCPEVNELLPAGVHGERVLAAVGPCREAALGLLSTPGSAAVPPVGGREVRSLRRAGKGTWQIQFGGRDVKIRHSVGLWRYARLLASPRKEVESVELAWLGKSEVGIDSRLTTKDALKQQGLAKRGGIEPREKIDEKTAAALRKARSEIEDEIEELEERRDRLLAGDREDEAANVDEQVELKKVELEKKKKALNLVAFNRREWAPSSSPRQAVANSLTYAREKIGKEIPELAEYLLANVRFSLGTWTFWPPPGDPGWEVDPGDF